MLPSVTAPECALIARVHKFADAFSYTHVCACTCATANMHSLRTGVPAAARHTYTSINVLSGKKQKAKEMPIQRAPIVGIAGTVALYVWRKACALIST